MKTDDRIRCSFCGKTDIQVRKLIAGPEGAYICDECVDICAEIIEEEFEFLDMTKNIIIVSFQKKGKINEG